MLGPSYNYYQECSGSYVIKVQMAKIRLQTSAKVADSSQIINENTKHEQLYTQGILYNNKHINHYFGCPLYPTFGSSTELDNEQIAQTKIPAFFPCMGPFIVENKHKKIGELRPHCYGFNTCLLFYFFTPYCTSLSVHDAGLREVYVIKKVPWTCFSCSKWQVFDTAQQLKSQIISTGCWPNFQFNLPQGSEQHRKLVMSALPHLP